MNWNYRKYLQNVNVNQSIESKKLDAEMLGLDLSKFTDKEILSIEKEDLIKCASLRVN